MVSQVKTEILNSEVSLYENLRSSDFLNVTINDLLSSIKDGTYIKDILEGREIRESNETDYKKHKINNLKAFTTSGIFANNRKKTLSYNGIVQVDIDYLESYEAAEGIKEKLSQIPYILAAFISPSGAGVKGLFLTNNTEITKESHHEAFEQVESYLKDKHDITIDKARKDINGLCFVSFDKDVYVNGEAEKFKIKPKLVKASSELSSNNTNNLKQDHKELALRTLNRLCHNISTAADGNKHNARLFNSRVVGGYVAGGYLEESYAISRLIEAAKQNTTLNQYNIEKDIIDGLEHGKLSPLHPDSIKRLTGQDIDKTTGELKAQLMPFCYWSEVGTNKPKLKINQSEIIDYLEKLGFCQIKIKGTKDTPYKLVQIINNVIYETSIKEIRNLLLNESLNQLPAYISENFSRDDLRELLQSGVQNYIYDAKLDGLKFKEIELKRDSSNESYFYFKNGFVTVNEKGFHFSDYSNLDGFIWSNSIIERNINKDNLKLNDNFDFYKFLQLVTTDKENDAADLNRFKALKICLGYLLHTYNKQSNSKAVVFTEANLNESAEGGTGKGLTVKAIRELRNAVHIDGKAFKSNSQFAFQNIDFDTQIVWFDDVRQNFQFDSLFSVITDGFEVERKGLQRYSIPFALSPKVVINSNYAITDVSGSSERRKYEMELLPYFDLNHTPLNEFQREFYSEKWTNDDWNNFYCVMFHCSHEYFKNDCEFFQYESNTIQERKVNQIAAEDEILHVANTEIEENKLYYNEDIYAIYNRVCEGSKLADKDAAIIYQIPEKDKVSSQELLSKLRKIWKIKGYEVKTTKKKGKRQTGKFSKD